MRFRTCLLDLDGTLVDHFAAIPIWAVSTGTHTKDELEAAGADRVLPDLVALRTQWERG